MTCWLRWYRRNGNQSRIPTWLTFGLIQWHVIPKPAATLQGAATWRIQCHDPRATCHIVGCCHLRNTIQNHMLQGRLTATWWIHCHYPTATCHIAGHKNSIRHIKNRFSSYFIFLVFLMQFWLWREAAFVSSAIHLLIWWNGAENFHQSSIYTRSPCSDFSCVLSQAAQ